MQPRYLLPAVIVLLAVLLTTRVGSRAWPTQRGILLLVGIALAVGLSAGSYALLDFYRWSPTPSLPTTVVLAASLVAAAGFAASTVNALDRLSRDAN